MNNNHWRNKIKDILLFPFWLIKEIATDIYYHFWRKKHGRSEDDSLADEYIEDRYF